MKCQHTLIATALILLALACGTPFKSSPEPQRRIPTASASDTPTPRPAPTAWPTSNPVPTRLVTPRYSVIASLGEAGFDFNTRKPEQTRLGEIVVGYSPYDENSSSAVVNLTCTGNDIKQAKLLVYDPDTAPFVTAIYLVAFIQSAMPEWEGGSVWLKNAIGRTSTGSRLVETTSHSRGGAHIKVKRDWVSDTLEVEINAVATSR